MARLLSRPTRWISAQRVVVPIVALALTVVAVQSAAIRLLQMGTLSILPVGLFDDARTILLRSGVAEPMLTTRDRLSPTLLGPARAAHRADPLDPLPFVVAGLIERDRRRARALFEQGARRDPRLSASRLHLIRTALQTGRYDQGIALLAQTVSLRPDQASTLMPALLLARAAPNGGATVMRAMRRDANLRNKAAVYLASAPDPDGLLPRLAAMGLSDEARTTAIAQLARSNRFTEAYHLWRGAAPGTTAEPFDPELRGLKAPAPFGWTLASDSNLTAFFGDDAGGHLAAEMFGRVRTPVVTQSILLKPGRYRLVAAAQSLSPALTGGAFDWSVNCADARSGAYLATMRFAAASSGAQSRAVDFTVAPTCPAQTLTLTALPGDNGRSFKMRFTAIRVEPA
jgi:hypothetical protein